MSGLHGPWLSARDRRRSGPSERRAERRRGRDPALAADGGHRELVQQDPRGRGRALPLPDRCPRARPVAGGTADPAVRQPRAACRRPLPRPQRKHPHLQDDLRGRRSEPDPAPPRDGLRVDAGGARALHDQQALPDLQRVSAQA